MLGVYLSACSTYRDGQLMNDGTVNVLPRGETGFTTTIRSGLDFGFDGDVRSDRIDLSRRLMGSACPGATLVGERTMVVGTWTLGTPKKLYFMDWQCG